MDFGFQIKLRGDDFNGHFTNGLSMANSESVYRCSKAFESDDKTVYETEDYSVTAYHINKNGVTECYTIFENRSERVLTLDMISSFCLENIDAQVLHRATSFWSAEGKLLSQNLCELNLEPSWSGHGTRVEKFGQTGSMPVRKWFPFVALENTKTGDFICAQLYCPSSWQIELFRNREPLTLAGGLADFDFGHWCKNIEAGETFVTPKAVIATGKTLNDTCDKLVKAQNPDISVIDADMPVVFNEYCTTWGNPTLENVKKIAEKISSTPIKYLVIDSGWYKESDANWWEAIGDWNPDKTLFPNGISEMSDMISSYGLIPGIWFEFEKVAPLSQMYKKEEYLLKRDGVAITVDGQRFLDMRKSITEEYLTEKVIDFLRDNGFGYIKIDYNDSLGIGCDGEESLGEGLRKNILGTQKFFRKMRKELPELVIEGCSSGGHRLEPSMMELVSQASFSDAHECTSIPLIAANLQRLIRAEQSQIWGVLRAGADADRLHYVLCAGFLGRLCLSGEIFDLTDDQWNIVIEAVNFYDMVKKIIKEGKTTIIDSTTVDYNNPVGYQAVLREYNDKALLVVHTFNGGANPPVCNYLCGYNVISEFGSSLASDFQAKVFYLEKSSKA